MKQSESRTNPNKLSTSEKAILAGIVLIILLGSLSEAGLVNATFASVSRLFLSLGVVIAGAVTLLRHLIPQKISKDTSAEENTRQ